jgi:hypothetical protein
MSKRRLETDEKYKKGKKIKSAASATANMEQGDISFAKMPVSSELINIKKYDVFLDVGLYRILPTSMCQNILTLHSLYKQISHKILVTTLIKHIQAGNDDAEYIGHNLALLAAWDDNRDVIKQVIEVIADKKLKAKSIGSGLYRLAKAESDAPTIKRTLGIIEDQSLKTKAIAIGLYLLSKDEGKIADVARLVDAIEDQSVIKDAINSSIYWLSKDYSHSALKISVTTEKVEVVKTSVEMDADSLVTSMDEETGVELAGECV